MKKEDLISQLELLPDGAEIFVRKGHRIAEPYLCFYSVNPYPQPEKLVGYIETFFDTLAEGFIEGGRPVPEGFFDALTTPCHEHLFQVCHHGRDVMGTCLGCDEELEDA